MSKYILTWPDYPLLSRNLRCMLLLMETYYLFTKKKQFILPPVGGGLKDGDVAEMLLDSILFSCLLLFHTKLHFYIKGLSEYRQPA